MKHFFSTTMLVKSLILSIALIGGLLVTIKAQVGFDNPNPDSSALIDMMAKDKGLLIPRMTSTDRTNMTANGKTPAHAVMVFDTDENMFFMYDTITVPNRWVAMNPWVSQGTSNPHIVTATTGNVGIGTTAAPTEKLEVNGKAKAQEFIGHGTIPLGGIIMWSGSPTAIPDGWALCDGLNGTPNLSGRFIVGYDKNDTDYSNTNKTGPVYTDADGNSNGTNTADAKTIRLTSAQSGLPAHSHTGYTSIDGAHTHNVNSAGDHLLDNVAGIRVPKSNPDYAGGPYSFDMSSAGNHSHTVYVNNSVPQSASQAFENRPPYYVLAFLIRVK